MYNQEDYRLLPPRRPKAPPERRAYAFLVDFILVWLISSLVQNIIAELLIFFLLWLTLRVVVVDKNQGQSIGRWAFDLKISNFESNKQRPPLLTLLKRESIVAGVAFLAMMGLKINFRDFLVMLLFLAPIIVDGFTALTDDEYNRSFHDRNANTVIIQTRRGYSLDLRLKKWTKEIKRNWQRRQRRD